MLSFSGGRADLLEDVGAWLPVGELDRNALAGGDHDDARIGADVDVSTARSLRVAEGSHGGDARDARRLPPRPYEMNTSNTGYVIVASSSSPLVYA